MSELDTISAYELVTGLAEKKWSSVQLTQAFLNRIKSANPQLHAVPFLFEEDALQQAKESDERRSAGKPLSPLDGLPMTVKDAIRIKGQPSTYGMWMLRRYRPRSDSRLVDVLRRCGIVFLGRTAVPTGAFDWNCRNYVYPECVNPFDSSRTPGGSSGGAAAALAKGLTPLELGSDLGGSIRYPAHCCGVYGLRTTDGWLPIEDVGPESFGVAFRRLVTFGPMARTVADLDLMLEPFAKEFPGQKSFERSPSPVLNIAYSKSILGMKPDRAVEVLFDAFLDRLTKQGHILVETHPEFNFNELYRDWGLIAGHEYTSAIPGIVKRTPLKRIHAWWILEHRLGRGPFANYFRGGMFAKESEYRDACERRKRIFEEVDRFFEKYIFWLLPVAPSVAIPRSLSGKEIDTPEGRVDYSTYLGSYTVPTTILGTPVLTCPIGNDSAQMPVGVQIHGARFSDRQLVNLVNRIGK